MAQDEPFIGMLYFSLLVGTSVLVLLNIVLSVVMETYKAVSTQAQLASGGDARHAPSFLLAVGYALLSSRSQLVLAAAALEDMPASPTLRTAMRARLRTAGVGPTTLYALLHAEEAMGSGRLMAGDEAGSFAPAIRATVVETARRITRTRLAHSSRRAERTSHGTPVLDAASGPAALPQAQALPAPMVTSVTVPVSCG